MNDEGLVGTYQVAFRGYEQTSMMDQKKLTKLLNAIGADYLVQVSAGTFERQTKTETGSVSGNLESMEENETRVFGRVWHPKSPQPVWVGYANARASETDVTYIKANSEEFYYQAGIDLSKEVLRREGK